jgi:mono/diheme cytochrome c family protein
MRSLVLIPVLLLIGCSKSGPGPEAPAGGGDNAALTAQIEQGKQLYVEHCAKCHGDAGQGVPDKGPPVVGKDAFPQQPRPGAKRTTEFKTAADVFAFASTTMPGDAPGTLTQDQYLAIFAFDLTANGIKLEKPLDAAAAQAIVLHP